MEALILRRNYPVPVTFADLRRAYWDGWTATAETMRVKWTAALKSATGATDDVYAVVDGREVYIGRVGADNTTRVDGGILLCVGVRTLLERADVQGYWEHPHEVRLDLQGRVSSLKAIDAVVQRSLIEAEVRR